MTQPGKSYGPEADYRIAELERDLRVARSWLGLFLLKMRDYFGAMQGDDPTAVERNAIDLFLHYGSATEHHVVRAILEDADQRDLARECGERFDFLEL